MISNPTTNRKIMRTFTLIILSILITASAYAQPEISVLGGGGDVEIPNGSTTPITSNGTDFGEKIVGESQINFFKVDNSGSAVLILSGDPIVAISGTNAADFVVNAQPPSEINPSNDEEFEITFTPSGLGERTATVSIANDDSDENPYTFAIKGTGIDNSPPQIICPSEQSQNLDAECSLILGDYIDSATVTDNADPNPTVTQSPLPGTAMNGAGTAEITLTATDASGNSANCTFTLNKVDNTNPVVDQYPNQTLTGGGACSAILPDYTTLITASDNCDQNVSILQSPVPTDLVNNGALVTITVIDASNNSTEMSFTINVEDQEAPNISPITNQEVAVNENCIGILPDLTSVANVSDNCDANPAVTQSPAAGTTMTGATQVTITATDASGNSSSVIFTATPKDLTAPVLTCPDNISVISATPIVVNYDMPTATDNCDDIVIPTLSAGFASGSEFPPGITTVTWEATDTEDNSVSCSFTVFVGQDSEAPTITCPGTQTQNVDDDCEVTLNDFTSLADVNDNVDPNPVVTQSPLAGATSNGDGNIEITLTATDAAGNSSNCTFTLNKVDNTAPVVSCPANLTIEVSSTPTNVTYDMPTATDNCSASVTPSLTSGPASGGSFPAGETTVTWSATDGANNTSTCSFTVTVEIIDAITEITEKTLTPIPNPTTGMVWFDTDLVNENIVVFNLQGQQVFNGRIPADGQINLNALNIGLYIVRFEDSKYVPVRLIIQR